MPRDYRIYLEDILGSIRKIRTYLAGNDWRASARDSKTMDAILRNLEIIGEAAKNLPPDLKRAHSSVEWRKIAGLRDLLAHQYFGVDVAIIGNIIEEKLPQLERTVKSILEGDQPVAPGAQEAPARYRAAKGRGKPALSPSNGPRRKIRRNK